MNEFELVKALVASPHSSREAIARTLGLALPDMWTEEGLKRQFLAAKAEGKLAELQQLLSAKSPLAKPAP